MTTVVIGNSGSGNSNNEETTEEREVNNNNEETAENMKYECSVKLKRPMQYKIAVLNVRQKENFVMENGCVFHHLG